MFCWAPVILAGYLFTLQTTIHHTVNVNAPVIEAQTCERGLGLEVKASGAGLYGTGLQYGFGKDFGDWSVTFQPKAGLSFSSQDYKELPAQHQFEVGAQILVGYKDFRIGVEYWHLSNAGLKQPNIGLDMIGVTTGWRF